MTQSVDDATFKYHNGNVGERERERRSRGRRGWNVPPKAGMGSAYGSSIGNRTPFARKGHLGQWQQQGNSATPHDAAA